MSETEYYTTELSEMGKKPETPTLDTSSEEDPKLYQDAEGGHAKIDTDKGTSQGSNELKGKAKASAKIEKPVSSGSSQERMEQHLTALFDGEDLSEAFQGKAATIFEAAINERVGIFEDAIIEQYQSHLTESIEETTKDLIEKLDDYLGYVVEQWMEENALAVENGIRTDVAENFISGMKTLFEDSYIDMPDEKYDVLGDVTDANEQLEDVLNSALEENIALRKEIVAHRCGEVFAEETDGLTDVEVDKLATLSEGLEFENETQYREKINVLRESYFTNAPSTTEELVESAGASQLNPESGSPMDGYMNSIHRHSKADRTS